MKNLTSAPNMQNKKKKIRLIATSESSQRQPFKLRGRWEGDAHAIPSNPFLACDQTLVL